LLVIISGGASGKGVLTMKRQKKLLFHWTLLSCCCVFMGHAKPWQFLLVAGCWLLAAEDKANK
jgi:hypothetical protein